MFKEKCSLGIFLKYILILSSTLELATTISLNQVTSKPRLTKFTTSSAIPESSNSVSTTPNSEDSGVAYYRLVNAKTDSTCILLKTDAVVEVKFMLHDLPEEADTFIPTNPLVEGDCRDEDASYMRISWTGYSLVINFDKTPGGERWYISNLELTISPNLPKFHGIVKQGKSPIKLYHRKMLVPTPVGKSFACPEVEIPLETEEEDHPPKGVKGTILFRLLRVQPFMFRGENFEEAFECRSQTAFRDETAPVVVGSTLAVAVLVTITGYGIYRYTRVKNVQYNTME